jgi:hypothetical protein
VYILFNCANKIFSSYGTSLRGKTLADYLSFPFIIPIIKPRWFLFPLINKCVLIYRKAATSTKAMKLGSKSRDVESFVDQLKSEGEQVMSAAANQKASVTSGPAKMPAPQTDTEE